MAKRLQDITTWIITEGIAGTQNQCIGVVEALGLTPFIHKVILREPWKTLSPYLGLESYFTFNSCNFIPIPPWPDLLVCSGRKSIAAARYIKRKSPETFVAILQDPRVRSSAFDLIAVHDHDPTRGKNIITTTGAPNRINIAKLEQAKAEFSEFEFKFKKPRVAILIGGSNKIYTLNTQIMDRFIADLACLSKDFSLMITASRRTGEDNLNRLQQGLAHTDAFIWDNSGPNPYFAFLAYADYIIVTADSVSMLSEAATTGKPVYMLPLEGRSKRFTRFYKSLEDQNCMKVFEGKLEKWNYTPLNESYKVAQAIKTALITKGKINV